MIFVLFLLTTVGSLLAAPAGVAPPITIFLAFEKQPSDSTIEEMKREVALILRPSGLRLDWRLLNEPRGPESFADLVVMKFAGHCQMSPVPYYSELGPASEGAALAYTKTSEGRILPFSEVQCDEIRRYIAPLSRSIGQKRQDIILGRAMGRVVAHELYHILAGTAAHGPQGVARSFHTRKELVGDNFTFDARDSVKLRELKWRALLAGEARVPDENPR
ncbi:MAG: hypothetical protein M3Z85_15995 [Acidobacteriota bacterium]|nr:hypothetical protein [Acidobacteriota bacterium]